MLRLDLDAQAAASSPLRRLTAIHGSLNDVDTTTVAEPSIVSTETPSPSDLFLPKAAEKLSNDETNASKEPKKIFVVKVSLSLLQRTQIY
jgi:hypothetical protein